MLATLPQQGGCHVAVDADTNTGNDGVAQGPRRVAPSF